MPGIPHTQGGAHSAPRPAPLQLSSLPNFPAITDPRTAAAFQSAFAALREGVSALQPVCEALGPGAGGTRFQTIIDGLDTLGCTPLHAAAAGGQAQVRAGMVGGDDGGRHKTLIEFCTDR
jgi:hypothetical protein